MKKFFLGTAPAVFLAGPAMAADIPVRKAPPPVSAPVAVYSWTGCYLGAGGGYGMFNQETQLVTDPGGTVVAGSTIAGGRGWFGTVQVGCDYQIGSTIVVGVFGDYDFSGIRGDLTPAGLGIFGLIGGERLRSSWAVGGRAGWVVVPPLLVYFSGGYTQARFGQVDFNNAVPGFLPPDLHLPATTYDGWFIGTGYEYGFGFLPGLYWKTEYRFADYGAERVPLIITSTGAPLGIALDSHKYVHTVRSELVWRFSFGGAVAARY
jgi:outer membrane immunogenic protein